MNGLSMTETPEGRAKRRLQVSVTLNVEPLDFDAWADAYVAAVLDADDRTQTQRKAA